MRSFVGLESRIVWPRKWRQIRISCADKERCILVGRVQNLNLSHLLLCCRRQLIATGDAKGIVKIWRLGDDLTNQGPRDMETLRDLANTQTTEWAIWWAEVVLEASTQKRLIKSGRGPEGENSKRAGDDGKGEGEVSLLPFPSSPACFIFSSSGLRSARRPNKASAD